MQTRNETHSHFEEENIQVWHEEQEGSCPNGETLTATSINSSLSKLDKEQGISDQQSQEEVKGEKKTLLDWLNFGATAAISLGLFILNWQQFYNAEARQKHEIMSTYLSQMAQLQLDTDFKTLPDGEAKLIASAATLNTLRQLDGEDDREEKGQLLKFLYKANLIGKCQPALEQKLETGTCQHEDVLDLNDAKLDGTMFMPPMPDLSGVSLVGASLTKAELSGVGLRKAQMTRVNLNDAILNKTLLTQSQLNQATLERANLVGAVLIGADLSGSSLRNADLRSANLSGANLQETNLSGAVYNKETIFPEGFDEAVQGMILCTTPVEKDCEALK